MGAKSDLTSKLATYLQSCLSPDLRVSTAYASASVEGLTMDSRPDLVVSGRPGMRPVIIEVKGEPDQDLPLTTAYITQVLYEANKYDDPRIALVTSAKVGGIVRKELDNQNVKIFNATDFNRMVKQLASYIEST